MSFIKTLFFITEITGIIAFSISGAMHALRKKLDIFGVIFIGLITSFGGGVIRDILLGKFPPNMFYNYTYVTLAVVTCLVTFAIAYFARRSARHIAFSVEAPNTIFDAIGLAAFSVSGVQTAILAGYGNNVFLCLSLGMITATGGGVLRDMLSRDIPLILRKDIYATASLLGCLVYFLMNQYNINHTVSILCSMILIITIRLVSYYYKLGLPKIDRGSDIIYSGKRKMKENIS